MKAFKCIKNAAPILALAMAAIFAGCSNSSDGGSGGGQSNYTLPKPEYHPASAMVATQTAAATDGKITVNPTTKTLKITGAAGKTFYMVRFNTGDTAIAEDNTRYALPQTQASVQAQTSISAQAIQDAFEMQQKDPRALLEERFLENISKIKASKNAAPAIQASVDYNVGATEDFLQLTNFSTGELVKKTFKLFASYEKYNLWVKADDPYYTDPTTFESNAKTAGEKFFQGYKLISHIYGEPSSKLYNGSTGTGPQSEKGNMSDLSKCGDKINIMFFSMLNEENLKGLEGYVNHADNYYDSENNFSNNGRFLYIDSSIILNDLGNAYTTMLHEFSHAISYNQKTLKNKVKWTYWYGEMLAMLCEDMMQNYLGVTDDNVTVKSASDGVSSLKTTPKGRLSLANRYGGTYGLTGNGREVYAEAFELGAWLARRFGGVKLVKELATNAFVDSIVNAVNKVNGTNHTIQSLMPLFAEDMLEQKTGAGLNKNAATYSGDATLTCDNNGTTYLYPFTAIDLWNTNQFYDWYVAGCEALIQNQTRLFSGVPNGNIYGTTENTDPAHENVYVGPCLFKSNIKANIGPYGYCLAKIVTATQDTVTITFTCDGDKFGDAMTIYVK